MTGGAALIYSPFFDKTLRSSFKAVGDKEKRRLPQKFHSRSRGIVLTGGVMHAMGTITEVSRPLPECYRMRGMIYLALTLARMTLNLKINLRVAGKEEIKRYNVRSSE